MDDMQQEQAPRASQSRRIQFYDITANSCASDSVASTEIAVERGSLRALKERNDANSLQQSTFPFVDFNKEHNDNDNDNDEDDHEDDDEKHNHPPYSGLNWNPSSNVVDDHHDTSKDSVRGRIRSKPSFWLRKFSKFRKKRNSSYSEASDSLPPDLSNMTVRVVSGISNEAWMCGCCGKIFSTLAAADSHEQACIQSVIASHIESYASLSPVQPQPSPSQMSRLLSPTNLAESTRSIYKSARSIMPESNLISSLRPPLLSIVAADKPRNVSFSEAYNSVHQGGFESIDMMEEENLLMLTNSMKRQVITTDKALIESVLNVASQNLLSPEELDAEYELEQLAKDRQYYITMAQRRSSRQSNPMTKFRTEGKSVASKIQNKLIDAWQLIKEGDPNLQGGFPDEYNKHRPNDQGGMGPKELLVHDGHTHYINVVVKHSIHVVNSELERLAQKRWHDAHPSLGNDNENNIGVDNNDNKEESSPRHKDAGKFEQFRKFAHVKLIKLAKLALAADFTPRKVAVQLSNDLYRLMAPQLKRRGVIIETELEYRVGPFFVLAVNIISIDWTKLIQYSHKLVNKKKDDWIAHRKDDGKLPAETSTLASVVQNLFRLSQLTRFECLAQLLAWMYYLHWAIYTPICWLLFKYCINSTMHKYILATVTDEIFSYVEEKGMEMEIRVMAPDRQAAFMLSALRELRKENSDQKHKNNDNQGDDTGEKLSPLMGPAIVSDKGPAPPHPPGFQIPPNLEFINLDIDLPVGFKRLRWAMLSSNSKFTKDALFREAKCENVIIKEWSHHDDVIGAAVLPQDIQEENIVGAEREAEYLMPKSTFVKANTVYDTTQIIAYNDSCLCLKKKTLSPEVPYGSTFVTWTQILLINTGNDSCHMTTSVEAEFPNGPPLISRQIVSGMRSGTAESFVRMSEIIIQYSTVFP